jgi:hypothetical protein
MQQGRRRLTLRAWVVGILGSRETAWSEPSEGRTLKPRSASMVAMSDSGPKQVDGPDYHHVNHTVAQTCGWTALALRGATA